VKFVSQNRLKLAVSELPDILDLMSVSLSAGDGLFGALARVVPRANGVLADSLKKVLGSLELGADLDGELDWLSKSLPQRQVVEFTSKLSMALHKGAPLSQMLRSLAESTRAELRNDLLRRAGRNETRMLVPLVFLILPVTVLFAVYPSLQLLNIEYT
jgi:tight adherence protein C